MNYYTTLENLEEACLTQFIQDAYPNKKFIDISKISPQTREDLFNDLISKLRHDTRLEEVDEYYTFSCDESNLLLIEREYNISMVNAEELMWERIKEEIII